MKLEKVTNGAPDTRRRWYGDACGTAFALELVGERWSLLIVRELMFGPRRFGEIRANLPGISANVLTQRLEGLEAAGILQRRRLPPPASVQAYELTPWGYESEPIFQEMGRWAVRSHGHDPSLPLSPASLMMSLRTMLAADRAAGFRARIGFRFPTDSFVARMDGASLDIVRGESDAVDFAFDCESPTAFIRICYGGMPIAAAEEAGGIAFSGDRPLADRFVTLFPLPPKIEAG